MNIGSITNPLDIPTLGELVTKGLNFAIGASAVICVAVLIGSGYMYITAAGDESKIEKAGKSLTFAIVGLAIAFIAVLLVNFVLDEVLMKTKALVTTVIA
ncbi:hypothetical protein M0Q97_06425 [Candidatus Dojkabacteria bacterium]|jgi:hypothetical protein|nr:hypothetical protein [Candidatus Dojkabacteria bacterium]